MTDEISFGGKRNILLPFIFLTVAYVLSSISSIKVSFWILVIVAIVAILFIALSYRLKSSVSSTTETAEIAEVVKTTKPTEKKGDWINSRPVVIIVAIAMIASAIYLLPPILQFLQWLF